MPILQFPLEVKIRSWKEAEAIAAAIHKATNGSVSIQICNNSGALILDGADAATKELLNKKIEDVDDLQRRTRNVLLKAGIKSVRDLAVFEIRDMMNTPGFGKKAIAEIEVFFESNQDLAKLRDEYFNENP